MVLPCGKSLRHLSAQRQAMHLEAMQVLALLALMLPPDAKDCEHNFCRASSSVIMAITESRRGGRASRA